MQLIDLLRFPLKLNRHLLLELLSFLLVLAHGGPEFTELRAHFVMHVFRVVSRPGIQVVEALLKISYFGYLSLALSLKQRAVLG